MSSLLTAVTNFMNLKAEAEKVAHSTQADGSQHLEPGNLYTMNDPASSQDATLQPTTNSDPGDFSQKA
jgi:hypothetical protein